MLKIWKYEIYIKDEFTLQIPKGAEILSIDTQNDVGYLWILVDADKPFEDREFCLFGTGQSITIDRQDLYFIGTFHQGYGVLIWHVFERLTQTAA